MKFEIQKPRREKLAPIMLRLRPAAVGMIRKIAFANNVSMQELASQMIEHCLEEMKFP